MRSLAVRFLVPACWFGLVSSPGCAPRSDFTAPVGWVDPGSEARSGPETPVPPGDLEATAARGRLLYAMERALRLGYQEGVFRMGLRPGDVILPLVDVDPGGRSGQVLFVRWTREALAQGGELDPEQSQRWLLVSLTLAPDSVLDIEQLHGPLDPQGSACQRVRALLAASRKAQSEAPGQLFHLHALLEEVSTGSRRTPTRMQTRAYLLAADPGGVDLEMVLDEAPRHRLPEVLSVTRVHAAGQLQPQEIHTPVDPPGPVTVARVLERGPGAGAIRVTTPAPGQWTISSRDGSLRPSASLPSGDPDPSLHTPHPSPQAPR